MIKCEYCGCTHKDGTTYCCWCDRDIKIKQEKPSVIAKTKKPVKSIRKTVKTTTGAKK